MKSILKRAERTSRNLKQLNLKEIKLTKIKVAEDNPDTGNFRLRGLFSESEFIEIFQFYSLGRLTKYSYIYVIESKSILRYDNAPHHKEFDSFPDHKHVKNKVKELKNPSLENFIKELLRLRAKR